MNRFKLGIVAAGSAMLLSVAMTGAAFAETNTNSNTQKASNTAVVQQTAAGVSGDALADNSSTALSGGASALALAGQGQTTVQLGLNQVRVGGSPVFDPPAAEDDENTNSNDQTAQNGASSGQGAAAVTGTAAADNESAATSGDAAGEVGSLQEQAQVQLAANQVELDSDDDE